MGAYGYDELGIWGRSLSTDDVDALNTLFFDDFDGAGGAGDSPAHHYYRMRR